MSRLLVVDGSHLMVRLVEMLVPDDVEVVQASRFSDARTLLAFDPPDAAIFNLTPSDLQWSRLVVLCHEHSPVIPFVLCSTLERNLPEELDLPFPPLAVVTKPVQIAELRQTLDRLLDLVSTKNVEDDGGQRTAGS
jgi:two-component SAPR family response regulator